MSRRVGDELELFVCLCVCFPGVRMHVCVCVCAKAPFMLWPCTRVSLHVILDRHEMRASIRLNDTCAL